jgi:hypothetical protein
VLTDTCASTLLAIVQRSPMLTDAAAYARQATKLIKLIKSYLIDLIGLIDLIDFHEFINFGQILCSKSLFQSLFLNRLWNRWGYLEVYPKPK